jgi:hypothetical protein
MNRITNKSDTYYQTFTRTGITDIQTMPSPQVTTETQDPSNKYSQKNLSIRYQPNIHEYQPSPIPIENHSTRGPRIDKTINLWKKMPHLFTGHGF